MRAGEKGFTGGETFRNFLEGPKSLIKKILTPAFVAMSNKAHELARGMQGKRPGPASQFQPRLLRGTVSLAVVAAIAAGHQVLPGRTAATGTRNDMIQREFRAGKNPTAKLAGVPIAQQDILSGKGPALLWGMPVRQQTNYRRNPMRMSCGMDFRGMELFGLRYSLEHQDHRASHCGDVDGLVSGV